MKVPYLQNKRTEEMMALASDFSKKIAKNLSRQEVKSKLGAGSSINELYSLFTLIEILIAPEGHLVNPSKEYALESIRRTGDPELFFKAIRSFNASDDISNHMNKEYSTMSFNGFITELRSDILMAFVQILINNYRGSAISLRCALEDLYRHIYYMHHSQEYIAIQNGIHSEYALKINPQVLRDHLKMVSFLEVFCDVSVDFDKPSPGTVLFNIFGLNDELYSNLSSAVHGNSNKWFSALENANSLEKIDSKELCMNLILKKFTKVCISLLIATHKSHFCSISDYDKSIIFDCFLKNEKSNFRKLLNV